MADIPNATNDVSINSPDGLYSADVIQTFGVSGSEYGVVDRNIPRKVGQVLSTTPILANATYTSAWFDSTKTGGVFVRASVLTDQVSATNGFSIETAVDTADAATYATEQFITVPANTLTILRSQVRTRYWRVKYVNGAVNQTLFKISATESSTSVIGFDADGNAKVVVNNSQIPVAVNNHDVVAIHAGQAFFATGGAVVSIAKNANLDILFKTPATGNVHLRDVSLNVNRNAASGYVEYQLFEQVTVSANGTALPVYNNKRDSATVAQSQLYNGPTVTGTGTKLMNYLVHSDWETYVAPSYTSQWEIDLKPNTNYLMRMVNNLQQTIEATWIMFFFEQAI